MPTAIAPELATLTDKIPTGDDWLHEIKFDGYRIIAFKRGQTVTLISRNNRDWSVYFENIIEEIKKLPVKNLILDGEIVLLDKQQKSSFQLLQNAIHAAEKKPFIYYIFDLLFYDKFNLMLEPLALRKNKLKQLLASANLSALRYSDHVTGSGTGVFKNACAMHLEGIVSKDKNSPYEERRNKSWLKTKCIKRQEFLIGGFSPPKKSREYFGSLYLGYYNQEGALVYCGNVGTGFTQASLKEIHAALKKNITAKNPFKSKPKGITTATWVNPVLICEIEFTEWTQEGMLRHPSFKGLRMDKKPRTITKENPIHLNEKDSPPYKLTHPNKIWYPEDQITKADIAAYYDQIQDWILPYVINRPLTLVRCPENYKSCFYQKHLTKNTAKGLFNVKIEKQENGIYIKDHTGLMTLIQMGTLEIHTWGSCVKNIEYPDMITFDLDPAPNVAWKEVVTAAKRIRKHLANYHLVSFVKTTGGKGLHVVIPIEPEYDWETIKNFAHVFVDFLVKKYPNEYIATMSKAKRQGKIFIDYLRNQRGATAICAYSTRARNGAPVSMPIAWEELSNKAEKNHFTIETALKRLEKLQADPWEDFFNIKQSLRLDKLK